MLLKDFVNLHQEKFQKTPVEIYNTDKEFLQELISNYPDRVPNVFIEVETKDLYKTRFYKWWDKRRVKPPEDSEIIKRTTKIIKEVKIKKEKEPRKELIVPQKEEIEKIIEPPAIINNSAIIQEPDKEIKPPIIINQTKEYHQVYHKTVFKTNIANESYKTIELNLQRIKLKTLQISDIIKEYRQKIQESPLNARQYFSELQCYEKMYKLQSDSFNDYQGQLTQLRMTIENDKQIYDNKLYISDIEDVNNIRDEELERVIEEARNKYNGMNIQDSTSKME
jgi:hypothetical protein